MIAGTCLESECIAAVTLVDGDKVIERETRFTNSKQDSLYNAVISGWFRARRCAEQEIPGSQTGNQNWRKGVTTMVKNVFFRMTHAHPVALCILGWLAFVAGSIVKPISLKVMLLSVARVLP